MQAIESGLSSGAKSIADMLSFDDPRKTVGVYVTVIISLVAVIGVLSYVYHRDAVAVAPSNFVSYIDHSEARKHYARIPPVLGDYFPQYTRAHTEG